VHLLDDPSLPEVPRSLHVAMIKSPRIAHTLRSPASRRSSIDNGIAARPRKLSDAGYPWQPGSAPTPPLCPRRPLARQRHSTRLSVSHIAAFLEREDNHEEGKQRVAGWRDQASSRHRSPTVTESMEPAGNRHDRPHRMRVHHQPCDECQLRASRQNIGFVGTIHHRRRTFSQSGESCYVLCTGAMEYVDR
jgi:hypothetical protein